MNVVVEVLDPSDKLMEASFAHLGIALQRGAATCDTHM
jgi:hypothetical protein